MSEEAPKKAKRPIRQLTASQRAEATALWRSGTVTLDDLAKQFKKSRSTFINLFKKDDVKKGADSAETEKRVAEAVAVSIVGDATKLAERIKDTKEDHYKYATGIAKLAWQLLVKAKQDGMPVGSVTNDMKALQSTITILRMAREEKYAVLGIRPEDDDADKPLPDLVIQELTQEDIQAMHSQSVITNEDMGLISIDPLGDESLVGEEDEDGLNDRVETE